MTDAASVEIYQDNLDKLRALARSLCRRADARNIRFRKSEQVANLHYQLTS